MAVKTADTSQEGWLDRPLLALINIDREKVLYALFIALAIFTRLWDLGVRVMSHDETVHIQWSWYLFQGRGYSHTPLSHGPFLFHTTALSYYLFGDTDFSARLVVAIMGIVLVALPYALRRWLGRSGALVTSFLFLISPSLLYYSRYIRHDIPVIVWSLIAVAAIFHYLAEARRPEPSAGFRLELTKGADRWLIILAAALSLMFATKEVSYIYIAICGLFLLLLFFERLGAPRWTDPKWEQWSRSLLWVMIAGLLVATLAFSLSGLTDRSSSAEGEGMIPNTAEDLGASSAATDDESPAYSFLRLIRQVGTVLGVGALVGYIGLLAMGAPSHRRIILTLIGVSSVILIAVGFFLFSLNLVQLFPIRFTDCGQAPVPDAVSGKLSCTQGDCELIQGRCQRPIPIVAGDNVAEFDETGTRIAIELSRLDMFVVVVFVVGITLLTGAATYYVLKHWMPFRRGERPAFDLILFIGSFTLPFLSALAISALSRVYSRLFFNIDAAFYSLDYSEAGLLRSAGFVFILLAVAIAAGLFWDWRGWLAAATVYFAIFVVLFTTVFTNGNGLASGTVGSLGYWLEQQDVQRGSQPWYYYGLLVPLYEYLPAIGFISAVVYVLVRSIWPRRASSKEVSGVSAQESSPATAHSNPLPGHGSLETRFVGFLFLWNVLTWLAYSVAGEKMPWLTTHFAVPLILATGWLVGRLIAGADWRTVLRRGGWIVVLASPIGFSALVQTVTPWFSASAKPFSGYGLNQLNSTMQFISALLVLSLTLGALRWVWRRIGPVAVGGILGVTVLAVLAVLTIRTAWLFAYVNYDYATEFMVYAHSTPDVREVMEQIEDISRRTSGDLSLNVAYTGDGSYPFIWYLRNYPNASQLPNPPSRPDLDRPVIVAGDAEWSGIEPYLGDNYTCNQYDFLWWPMQDYYSLNWERIRYALTNPEMRAALWDIIFRRDYRKYEETTGKTVRTSEWPLRDGFRFCIRRDVSAQVWSERAAAVDFVPEFAETGPELPDFTRLEMPAAAELVVSALGGFGDFNAPHGMAVDSEGFLYVADSNNHRIVKLSPGGQVVATWDSTWWRGLQTWKPGCLDPSDRPLALDDGQFCEPWGVAVGPDGKVYVADTWNHRIQVFTSEGQFLGKFGTFGQSASSVSSAPTQFYGPRDVEVDDQGYIYVSDTGNKRIQVFDSEFRYVRAFGGPGIVEGRLEEPVGLSLGPDGLLYIADTWNNRIQALSLEGAFVRQWPIAGWNSQSVVNKPYLTNDTAGRVYVSDPEGARVLIFDASGNPLAVLGGPTSALFQLPTGVTLDEQGRLWISDADNHRLLRFPAFQFSQPEEQP